MSDRESLHAFDPERSGVIHHQYKRVQSSADRREFDTGPLYQCANCSLKHDGSPYSTARTVAMSIQTIAAVGMISTSFIHNASPALVDGFYATGAPEVDRDPACYQMRGL